MYFRWCSIRRLYSRFVYLADVATAFAVYMYSNKMSAIVKQVPLEAVRDIYCKTRFKSKSRTTKRFNSAHNVLIGNQITASLNVVFCQVGIKQFSTPTSETTVVVVASPFFVVKKKSRITKYFHTEGDCCAI